MGFTVYNLIYLVICFAEGIIAWQYFSTFGNTAGSRKIQTGALAICYGIIYIIFFFSDHFYFNLIPFFLLNALLAAFIFDIRSWKAVLHSGILTGLLAAAQWIVNGVTGSVLIIAGQGRGTLSVTVLTAVLGRIVYLALVQVLIRLVPENEAEGEKKRLYGIGLLCLATAATCWGTIVLLYLDMKQLIPQSMEWLVISGAVMMLLANVIIYLNAIRSRFYYKEYTEARILLEKENTDVAYYRMLAQRNEEQKIMIHDVRKHMNVLNGLLETQAAKEARDYIQNILNEPALQPGVRICDNQMVNLILHQYQSRCEKEGIRFYPDIREQSLDFLKPEELTALLSNLLENAMEAAAGISDGYIQMKAGRRSRTQVLISMENSCAVPPKKNSSGQYITGKADSSRHGYGMKSIGRIVGRYQGSMDTHYDPEKRIFRTMILLTNNER